jgi:hypothetical protein
MACTDSELFKVGAPAPLLLLQAEPNAAADAIMRWRNTGLTVRTVRGRKIGTVERLFDEVAAALQFPYYFGENWAAFDECLADMDWLPMGAGVVVVILEAEHVLVDNDDVELGVLVRTIERAADAYSCPIALGEWWDRPAVPFHVILQSQSDGVGTVRARWEHAGAVMVDLVD